MNRTFRRIALFLFPLFVSFLPGRTESANATVYHNLRNYTVDDGLSSNHVYGIVQDSVGFIWFGTDNGLCRFDGHEFRSYTHADGDRSSTSSNNIRRMTLDSRGQIWLALDNGVDIYTPATDRFRHFDARTADGTSVTGQTTEVIEDRGGEIWIATVNSGLFRWNPETNRLTVYRHLPNDDTSIAQDYISTIYESKDGTIWIGTYSEGLCAFSKQTERFTRYRKETDGRNGISDNSIDAITEDSYGTLWLGTVSSGLDRFERSTGRFTNYDDRSGERRLQRIHYLKERAPGELLVCANSGATLYRVSESGLRPVEEAEAPFTRTKCWNVFSFLYDREGNFWFGSCYEGVEFHPARSNFTCYATRENDNSDRSKVVSAVCEIKEGHYLLGTENNGILLFDKHDGTIVPYRTAQNVGTAIYNVFSLLVDEQTLWIAAFQRGIEAIDMKSRAVKSYLSDPSDPSSRVFVLCQSSSGRIWAGTSIGLYYYDRLGDRFVAREPGVRISDITEDHAGRLWIATNEDGLYAYDARTDRLRHYRYDPDDASTISRNAVNTLAVDRTNRLWIGTNGYGLCSYDEKDGSFVRYETLPLPSKIIQRIIPENDRLWITTDRGLVVFYPETGQLKRYSRADGLHTEQFMSNSGILSSDGRIVLGTTDGICSFTPPHDIVGDWSLYPAIITRFSLDGQPVTHTQGNESPLSVPIEHTRKITLSHRQTSVGFRFVSPTYLFPGDCRYRYRLDGLDDHWSMTDSRNASVNYNNLHPGEYCFRVQVGNGDMQWNPDETKLRIRIRPSFFRSKGALAGYAVLALLAAAAGLRYLMRRTEQQQREKIDQIKRENERNLYEQRISFFTNITHEIRTPLSLIIGPLEQVMKSRRISDEDGEYLAVIKQNYHRLHSLVNQLLDFRKIDSNRYKLRYDICDVGQLVREQLTMFGPTAQQRRIRLIEEIPDRLMQITDREALTKIVSNLLSNALRFADGEIHIRIGRRDNGLTIEVWDDGPGIPPEEREKVFDAFYQARNNGFASGVGIGLHLCRFFIRLMGGTIAAAERPDGKPGALLTAFIPEPAGERAKIPAKTPLNAEAVEQPLPQKETRPEAAVQQTADATVRTHTVMVVDDDSNILDFLVKMLGSDYFVISTNSGSQALNLLRSNDPDLIVSDIMMADIDGIELCRRIKNDISTSHIPVILLTARTGVSSKIEGLECGADAYIEKPFSPDQLKAQISSLLHTRDEIRRLYAGKFMTEFEPVSQHNRLDEEFILKCRDVIIAHMRDPDLSVGLLARELAMGRTLIFRKLKAVTGMTPNDFMKLIRLKEAKHMIIEGRYRITEIGFLTGFSSSSYFAKCFAKQFGILPTEFLEKQGAETQAPEEE